MIGGPLDGQKCSDLTPFAVDVERVDPGYAIMSPWRLGYYLPLSVLMMTVRAVYRPQKWALDGPGRRSVWVMVFDGVPEADVRKRVMG